MKKSKNNELCPCSSGKVYQNCCQSKDNFNKVIRGTDSIEMFEDKMKIYSEAMKKWNFSEGNPPTFKEFFGQKNAATSMTNDLQKIINSMNPKTEYELREIINQEIN